MDFLDRDEECTRIRGAVSEGRSPCLVVLYGRRRIGKSRLLQEAVPDATYCLADENEASIQRERLAGDISMRMEGFDEPSYQDWTSLLNAFNRRCSGGETLILDEFPYLVKNSPELPSVLQAMIDKRAMNFHLIICGSSQRMMQGLVLSDDAPLYGRAKEIVKLEPLPVGYISSIVRGGPVDCIEHYSVWGGVPRYWELVNESNGSLKDAVTYHVLNKNGVLHNEPKLILSEDMRDTVQSSTLLNIIANGCSRVSEIGGRIGKPASSLTRPLANLIELGYVKKDTPFGTSARSSKRSLYRLNDPFLIFWYRFVQGHKSVLELGQTEKVFAMIEGKLNDHTSRIWEDMCRRTVVAENIGGSEWLSASRWWGSGIDGQTMEFDIVAESTDRKRLLVGEVKWEEKSDPAREQDILRQKAGNAPFVKGRDITTAVWLKTEPAGRSKGNVLLPADVLAIDVRTRPN